MELKDIKQELDKVVSVRNKEYNKSFNDARKKTAEAMAEKYIHQNPDATKEEITDYVSDYLAQSPDEFQRNLRVYVNLGTTIFSTLMQLTTIVNELKDLYVISNKEKIEEQGRIYAEQLENKTE